jgi:hypothetical protein
MRLSFAAVLITKSISSRPRRFKLGLLHRRDMATSLPKTMRAIGIRKTGGLEVIEELELPVPTPEPEEVLVKVEWAGVNYGDTRMHPFIS